MRIRRLIPILALIASVAASQEEPSRDSPYAEEVTIMPVGPFGEALKNCKVDSFLTWDKGRPVDRRGRFTGLIGKHVPFGSYSASLKCDDEPGVRSVAGGVASLVEVHRVKTFLVISSHRWIADYRPGGGSVLRVIVQKLPPTSNGTWVKMVGLYLNEVHLANIDQSSAEARIVRATPGTYMLMLLAPGELICSKKVRVMDPRDFSLNQSLTIDAGNGCAIIDAKGIGE